MERRSQITKIWYLSIKLYTQVTKLRSIVTVLLTIYALSFYRSKTISNLFCFHPSFQFGLVWKYALNFSNLHSWFYNYYVQKEENAQNFNKILLSSQNCVNLLPIIGGIFHSPTQSGCVSLWSDLPNFVQKFLCPFFSLMKDLICRKRSLMALKIKITLTTCQQFLSLIHNDNIYVSWYFGLSNFTI